MRIAFITQWFPPEPGTFVAAAVAVRDVPPSATVIGIPAR
jgi:acetyltransferase-like isoleucine patch superfamily enzyme